jgi:hypothetical protein
VSKRTTDTGREMQISERELRSMTTDLEEIHHETLPEMHNSISEWAELNQQLRSGVDKLGATATSRRNFLLGAGAVAGGAVLLAACGSDSKSPASSGSATTVGGGDKGAKLTGDLAVAALAASLENLAVNVYQAGLDAATGGKLGAVPPAIATFATTVQKQHRDHAAAWNAVLTGAGKDGVTGIDMTVQKAVVEPGFAKVKNVVDLATFALALEDVAAATYLNGIQNAITSKDAIKIAASIQPIEMQHSAILNFVLGNDPVPNVFAKVDGARGPDDEIG